MVSDRNTILLTIPKNPHDVYHMCNINIWYSHVYGKYDKMEDSLRIHVIIGINTNVGMETK